MPRDNCLLGVLRALRNARAMDFQGWGDFLSNIRHTYSISKFTESQKLKFGNSWLTENDISTVPTSKDKHRLLPTHISESTLLLHIRAPASA